MNKRASFLSVLALCCCMALFLASCGGGGGGSSAFAKPSDGNGGPGDGGGGTEGTLKWAFKAGGALNSSAAVADDGTIYIGSEDGSIYAVNPDGTLKWKFETGGAIPASPAIGDDGTIYVGSVDRQIYAINPDGILKWVVPTRSNFTASPAIGNDGTIYVAGTLQDSLIICTGEVTVRVGYLYAVTPNGSTKWIRQLSGIVDSSPAIGSDGTIYVGSDGDILLDRVNPCDEESDYLPSTVNPFFTPVSGHLYAFRPDGSLMWDFGALGDVDSSPAIGSDGTIYVGSDGRKIGYGETRNKIISFNPTVEGYFYAINPNGTLKCLQDLFGDVDSSPSVASDGTIYAAGSDKNDIFALNPDCSIKWVFPTRDDVNSSAAIGNDGTIYVGSEDASLYALNPDGTLRWRFDSGGGISSSPSIIANGIIYVGSSDSNLYAVGSTSSLMDSSWPKFRHDLRNLGRQ